jgi:large subunit ribosomal protein L4
MASWLRQQRHILERTLPLLWSAQSALGSTAARSRVLQHAYYSMSITHNDRSYITDCVHEMNRENARLFSTTLTPPVDMSAESRKEQSDEILVDDSDSSIQELDVPVLEFETGKPSTKMCQLDEDIFHVPVRVDILHRVVRWQLARRQQGTHKTKTRSEVRGGGRKPWQQKGSGRARQGTIRAVQWRGGGVVHGPVVRSHAHSLQKRVRRLGLKCAVSAKLQEGRLIVVDTLDPSDCKTSFLQERVDALLGDAAQRRSALFVDAEEISDNLFMGTRNIPWVDVIPIRGLNVYSILQRDYLIMSTDAVTAFVERMKKPIRPSSATP